MTIKEFINKDKTTKKDISSLRNHLNSVHPIDNVQNKTHSKWNRDTYSFTVNNKDFSFCEYIKKDNYATFIHCTMFCKYTAYIFDVSKKIKLKK